ncbi:max-like protein X isoform X5 [Bubalus bubalis]|uniref:max-like protein X isoform X5 n=1 Tax=Bubalus bubalis TaxID=89462 RepID=UPI001D112BE1|nr:max-like protein X isoform X5 [Bubalus bubalis]XP_044794875.1 max-like protein X isoform X5 [Bubalus bubalis]
MPTATTVWTLMTRTAITTRNPTRSPTRTGGGEHTLRPSRRGGTPSREAMMIYRPSFPPANSRTSPLALKNSAKPSCCRRVWPGERWRAWSQGGSIDYIQFLHKEKKKQEEEVSTLRKDVMALKIMKVNYEQIVKAHQDNPHEGEDQVSDQVKFNVFQGIMDSLFQSFNASISVASFQELSACVFSWIEEHYPTGNCDWRPAPTEEPALLTNSWNLQNSQQEALSLLLGHGATGLMRVDRDTAH